MKWNIDPTHTNADFVAKHMMFTSVRGTFKDVKGVIEFDPANPAAASVDATVAVASVNTGTPDRDNHLRSADFFDAENHPFLTLKSKRVEAASATNAKVIVDLTIRGITHEVAFDVEFLGTNKNPWGMQVAGFTARAKVNREDYNLLWNQVLEAGGVLVGKEVKLELEVQAVLAAETQPA
jgi:polyisoprenoid-binding protein YceI